MTKRDVLGQLSQTMNRVYRLGFRWLVSMAALVLTACTVLTATPDQAPRQAIHAALNKEAQAWRENDLTAYQALLDPHADPAWRQERTEHFRSVAVPRPLAIKATRVIVAGEWALAAVIVDGGALPHQQMYTLRYLRDLGPAGWQLTPSTGVPREAQRTLWGARKTLYLNHFHLTYYAFDEPYVRAAAPKLGPYLAQVAQDLGVDLPDEPPLVLHLAPTSHTFWDETPRPKLPSPISIGFTLEQAASPEEYLAWGLYDALAGQLIVRAVGSAAEKRRWPHLVEMVRQWEVALARGQPSHQEMLASIPDPAGRPFLSELFNPSPPIGDGPGGASQRLALITFITETYGRQTLGPLVRALFVEDEWQAVVHRVFTEDPARFEERWQDWADLVSDAEGR